MSGDGWFVRTTVLIAAGIPSAIQIQVKTKANERPLIKQISLKFTTGKVAAGEEQVVQEPFLEPEQAQYAIAANSTFGPQIVEHLPYDAEAPLPGPRSPSLIRKGIRKLIPSY